ncbi:MAG: FHA domain-containing protein [Bacteroidota bacterium]
MPLTASRSLTTGLRVLGRKNIPAYTLEYLTPCHLHRPGTHDTIVVPVIELGRDPSCAVCFGKDLPTVSRKHAEIERQGQEIILKTLSQTNSTFVNGQLVHSSYYLQNGDIIQLSSDGPRLRFNISEGGFLKMGFTQRMNLLVHQSVRPYQKALIGLSVLMALLVIGIALFMTNQTRLSKGLQAQTSSQAQQIQFQDSIISIQDSLVRALDSIASANDQLRKEDSLRYTNILSQTAERMIQNDQQIASVLEDNQRLQQTISSQNRKIKHLEVRFQTPRPSATAPPNSAAAVYDRFREHIYFLQVSGFQLVMPDGTGGELDISWNGTGFLLSDGKFVTARHCIQGWRYITEGANEENLLANIAEQMGARITVLFEAVSPSGHSFTFTNRQVQLNDTQDQIERVTGPGGKLVEIKVAKPDQTDWAYFQRPRHSSLHYNASLSRNLRAATEVIILGYSYGSALQKSYNVDPLFSESRVARNGLASGLITLTDRNFGQGNSGGPVLAVDASGQHQVVGIVSAGLGSEIGIVVPISAIR